MLEILRRPTEIQRIAAALRLPTPSPELAWATSKVEAAKRAVDQAGRVNAEAQRRVTEAEISSTAKRSVPEVETLKAAAAEAFRRGNEASALHASEQAARQPLLAAYGASCHEQLATVVDLAARAVIDRLNELDELLVALENLDRDAVKQGVKIASQPVAGAAGAHRLLREYFGKVVRAWR